VTALQFIIFPHNEGWFVLRSFRTRPTLNKQLAKRCKITTLT